jgi:hypothetical protein
MEGQDRHVSQMSSFKGIGQYRSGEAYEKRCEKCKGAFEMGDALRGTGISLFNLVS